MIGQIALGVHSSAPSRMAFGGHSTETGSALGLNAVPT
jgi:hypothetical protein